MKKIFFSLVASLLFHSLEAQIRFDSFEPEYCIDASLFAGISSQNVTSHSMAFGYRQMVNASSSKPQYNSGLSYGGNFGIGAFFGKHKHWGVGLGLQYMMENGKMQLNNFHVEYDTTDAHHRQYRQIVSNSGQITEKDKSGNFNIPVMLKYRGYINSFLSFVVDAGLLYNESFKTKASMSAAYNYEAIYKFVGNQAVYDNSTTPSSTNDWIITQSQYAKTDGASNVGTIFKQLNSEGYNVGLGVAPKSGGSSNVRFYNATIGYIVKPALSYMLDKNICLNFGVYVTYQTINNGNQNGSQLISTKGVESPLINSISSTKIMNAGIDAGIRIYFYNFRLADTN